MMGLKDDDDGALGKERVQHTVSLRKKKREDELMKRRKQEMSSQDSNTI